MKDSFKSGEIDLKEVVEVNLEMLKTKVCFFRIYGGDQVDR